MRSDKERVELIAVAEFEVAVGGLAAATSRSTTDAAKKK